MQNQKIIDENINKYFQEIDENKLMTTTREGVSLCITPTRPSRPISKRLTNYVLEKQLKENFTMINDGQYVTTDKQKNNLYAITTRQRGRPLHKKQDNYVLEVDDMVKKIGSTNGHQSGNVYSSEGLSPTLSACDYKSPLKIMDNECVECIGSTQKHASRTDGTYTPTLTCAMGSGGGHVPMLKLKNNENNEELKSTNKENKTENHHEYRIRRLTPLECERLQGFPDNWTKYGENKEEISDTQRYKCCGNAVTTNVITSIINGMF